MLEIREYTYNDKAPFSEWLNKLDRPVKARVMTRIDRIRRGNLGDTKPVGDGVFELRITLALAIASITGGKVRRLLFSCVAVIRGHSREI